MGTLLRGTPVASALKARLISKTVSLKQRGIIPTLAVVRVGEKESDLSYERGVMKCCKEVGISVEQIVLGADCSQTELIKEIEKINCNPKIHGCLMFRPLPKHIDEGAVCEKLAPEKDIDCVTRNSLCKVFLGEKEGFPPCTAQACFEILDHYGIELKGKHVVVIGRSLVIGKPVSFMLQTRNATVTMCHTKTENMPELCRKAEILIVAAGREKTVNSTFVNQDQIVIDVGININADGKLCGDVDFDNVQPKVKALTPVPGGVGSVTTAVLCKHVIEATERSIAQQ